MNRVLAASLFVLSILSSSCGSVQEQGRTVVSETCVDDPANDRTYYVTTYSDGIKKKHDFKNDLFNWPCWKRNYFSTEP